MFLLYSYELFHKHQHPASVSFMDYLHYHSTEWFATSKVAQPLVLQGLVVFLCVVSAAAYANATKSTMVMGLWRCWGWLVSPDGGCAETNSRARLVGAGTSLAGVVVFALLVSMITQAFAAQMDEMKKSQRPIVESAHTVVLGWTDRTPTLCRELALAAESENGTRIAILDPRPLQDLRNEIDHSLDVEDLGSTVVIARSGNSFVARDLQRVAAETAKSIIIQSDPSRPAQQSDALAMQKVLSLKNHDWPKKGSIVVQVSDPNNLSPFKRIGGKDTKVIIMDLIIAQLMAQTSRCTGITQVLDTITGFEGDDFYVASWPELVGKTFEEVVFSFEAAVALGIWNNDKHALMAPCGDYVVQPGDSIIVLADDDNSYTALAKPAINYKDWCLNDPRSKGGGKRTVKAKPCRILVFGWNSVTEELLFEIATGCEEGSTVTVFAEKRCKDRLGPISQMQGIDEPKTTFYDWDGETVMLQVTHMEGSPVSRLDLAKLDLHEFDLVYLLADSESWGVGPAWTPAGRLAADAKSLATMVLVKDMVERQALPLPSFTMQVLDTDSRSTAEHTGLNDLVDSNRLVSRMLAMVSEEPRLLPILKSLVSARRGKSIDIVPVSTYLAPEELQDGLSYWDLVCLLRRRSDDVILGWCKQHEDRAQCRAHQHLTKKLVLNPKNKHQKFQFHPEQLLVVLGSDRNEEKTVSRPARRLQSVISPRIASRSSSKMPRTE